MATPLGLEYPTEWARREPVTTLRNFWLGLVVRPTLRWATSMEVRGLENLVQDQTMIFATNHVSHLDTPLVLSALPPSVRTRTAVAAAMDTFFLRRRTAFTTVLTFNAIPIERHKVNRRSAEIAAAVLSEGWHLLIYPEGGRTTTGDLQEFKGGAAYLAEKTGARIIPVFVQGAGDLMGRRYAKADRYRQRNRLRCKVVVAFGSPVDPAEGENVRRLGVRVEEAVAQLGRAVTGDDAYGRRTLA